MTQRQLDLQKQSFTLNFSKQNNIEVWSQRNKIYVTLKIKKTSLDMSIEQFKDMCQQQNLVLLTADFIAGSTGIDAMNVACITNTGPGL